MSQQSSVVLLPCAGTVSPDVAAFSKITSHSHCSPAESAPSTSAVNLPQPHFKAPMAEQHGAIQVRRRRPSNGSNVAGAVSKLSGCGDVGDSTPTPSSLPDSAFQKTAVPPSSTHPRHRRQSSLTESMKQPSGGAFLDLLGAELYGYGYGQDCTPMSAADSTTSARTTAAAGASTSTLYATSELFGDFPLELVRPADVTPHLTVPLDDFPSASAVTFAPPADSVPQAPRSLSAVHASVKPMPSQTLSSTAGFPPVFTDASQSSSHTKLSAVGLLGHEGGAAEAPRVAVTVFWEPPSRFRAPSEACDESSPNVRVPTFLAELQVPAYSRLEWVLAEAVQLLNQQIAAFNAMSFAHQGSASTARSPQYINLSSSTTMQPLQSSLNAASPSPTTLPALCAPVFEHALRSNCRCRARYAYDLRFARKNGEPKPDLPALDLSQPVNAMGGAEARFALICRSPSQRLSSSAPTLSDSVSTAVAVASPAVAQSSSLTGSQSYVCECPPVAASSSGFATAGPRSRMHILQGSRSGTSLVPAHGQASNIQRAQLQRPASSLLNRFTWFMKDCFA